jgi:ATP-dependent protease ClpP protease subunit
VSGGASGKAKDMEEDVIETLRLQKMIEDHTLEYTKITAKKLEKIYKGKRDWYIDTEEALKLRIIDEVIS